MQASISSVRMFSLWVFVLIWVGKRLSTQLLLAVGVCSPSEWKCICVTPLERVPGVAVRLRGEEHTCSPDVVGAGLAGVAARTQCSGLGATQQAQRTRVKSSMLPGRKSCGVAQMHAGSVYPRGEAHGVSVTAHWKRSAFSSKGESQQEAAGKAEEPSANSRTAAPQGPPRRPGGEHRPRQRGETSCPRAKPVPSPQVLHSLRGILAPDQVPCLGNLFLNEAAPGQHPVVIDREWSSAKVAWERIGGPKAWNKPMLNGSPCTVNFLPLPR